MATFILLCSCGGADGSSDGPVIPPLIITPTPPAPTPTPVPTVPANPSLVRLKAALPNGAPRAVGAIGLTVTPSDTTTIPNGNFVAPNSSSLRLLGGFHSFGPSFPFVNALLPQAINAYPSLPPYGQFNTSKYGINNGVEFILEAGIGQFEFAYVDTGGSSNLEVEVDGRLANDAGFPIPHKIDNALKFARIDLPISSSPRTIAIHDYFLPFAGINLPLGSRIQTQDTSQFASMVFEGDSITEGTGASTVSRSWAMQASYELGIRNPIVVAVGGSGYLAHRPQDATMPERIEDVTKALLGGPPHAVVIAAGINDCSVAQPSPFSFDQVGATSLAYFRALRAAAPNMLIFVVAPFTDYNNPVYSETSRSCRDTIFAAANQVSGTYTIDVSDWVTTANRDVVFGDITSGPHPIDGGHAIYGHRAALAIRTILNGL